MNRTLTAIALMVAPGAGPAAGETSEDTFEADGTYVYKRLPQLYSGMVGMVKVAVRNLREYNQKLEAHLNQQMTVENLEKIHQLSYTLENALQRMDKDLKSIASVLEGMHLASESRNKDKVKSNAETYLENTNMILGQN